MRAKQSHHIVDKEGAWRLRGATSAKETCGCARPEGNKLMVNVTRMRVGGWAEVNQGRKERTDCDVDVMQGSMSPQQYFDNSQGKPPTAL